MKKTPIHLLIWLSCLSLAHIAYADIYKSVDENGHITYSNVPSKGAAKLEIDPAPPANTQANKPKAQATPSNFPRVDSQTQKKRDDQRKKILIDELEAEKEALEEARKAYAEGESKPEVYRGANGKTYRNVVKFEEKMQQLQANVDAHEKNVQLLQKELDAFK
ncbi:DUF4124 domain-containing protein [Methylobacillus gramineus]|uniref:DUF4124 domain-containing protein n=1 Tax=Methylobacillus gramineus TaxID=755169 RepID=UPI001CFF5C3F|nr:DUF4124 domain-containing protein [Methylobacillus gramineus]MCB5186016.1 DUF4124 domain-containing protein [Methylobacillus gramineus]